MLEHGKLMLSKNLTNGSKITEYRELLTGHKELEEGWPSKVLAMQKTG